MSGLRGILRRSGHLLDVCLGGPGTVRKRVRRVLAGVRVVVSELLNICYPQSCIFCGSETELGYICSDCMEKIQFRRHASCYICGAESLSPDEGPDFLCSDCLTRRPAFDRAFVVTRYDAAVRDLVHFFKYRQGIWLTDDLVRMMVAFYLFHISPLCLRFDAIVPVPMQRSKFRMRGYNQADLLAGAIGKQLLIPVRRHYLRRVRTGVVSQTRLGREGRRRNAEAAFRAAHPRHLRGKTLLLVDDVLTTGATCDACAGVLKAAGAAHVYVLALARPIRV